MPENTRSQKPLPIVTEESRQFWEGCKEGILRLQYCEECHLYQFYPRLYCMHCGSAQVSWIDVSGHGVIYSYTIIHQNKAPDFVHDTPYNVAIVQLEEGPRMMSSIVGIEPALLRVDLPVKVVFEALTEVVSIPRFEPV